MGIVAQDQCCLPDLSTTCSKYVDQGYCVGKYSSWMSKNCNKSCTGCCEKFDLACLLERLGKKIEAQDKKIEAQEKKIEGFAELEVVCAYKYSWTKADAIITYQKLSTAIHTGSQEVERGQRATDFKTSGTYTVTLPGIYTVTYSGNAWLDKGQWVRFYLYKNGASVGNESQWFSNSVNGRDNDQGSRTVILELKAGDKLYLKTDKNYFTGILYEINMCIIKNN